MAEQFAEEQRLNQDRLFKDAFLASVYDAWYPSQEREDYAFYLRYALAAGRVLDIGCGTGTFLTSVRSQGYNGELTGIDPNPGVMELARRYDGIDWVQGRIEDQSWSEQFDLAVMTGHAFQTILGRTNLKRFLRSVANALQPGGVFAFESRNPQAREWDVWRNRSPITIRMLDNSEVIVTTKLTSDFDGETVSFVHTFFGGFSGSPLLSESTLQFFTVPVLREELQQAGFVIEGLYGDFSGAEFQPTSPEVIVIARRA